MDYEKIKKCIGVIGSFIFKEFFGASNPALKTLTKLMLLDFGTGLVKGVHDKDLNSRTASAGLLKKFTMLMLISLGALLDEAFNSGNDISMMLTYYLIVIEGLSITENASAFLPIPDQLTQFLEQRKDGNIK